MSHLQYFDYPGFGARNRTETNYSQAVRYDNILEISGQGGWDRLTEDIPTDIPTQVAQAFENVQHTLEKAGGKGWEQVFATRMFVVGWTDEIAAEVIKGLKKWCPGHQPLLTLIGVSELWKGMRLEIEVRAHLGGGQQ